MNKRLKTGLKYILFYVSVFVMFLVMVLGFASANDDINLLLNELDADNRLGDGLKVLLSNKSYECDTLDSGFIVRNSDTYVYGMRCKSNISYIFYVEEDGVDMSSVRVTCEGLNKKDLLNCFEGDK